MHLKEKRINTVSGLDSIIISSSEVKPKLRDSVRVSFSLLSDLPGADFQFLSNYVFKFHSHCHRLMCHSCSWAEQAEKLRALFGEANPGRDRDSLSSASSRQGEFRTCFHAIQSISSKLLLVSRNHSVRNKGPNQKLNRVSFQNFLFL